MSGDDGLGAAMSLDFARSQGKREALAATASCARVTAAALRSTLDTMLPGEGLSRIALLVAIEGWETFATRLGEIS